MLAAIRDQIERVAFVHRTQFDNTSARLLTERLLEIASGRGSFGAAPISRDTLQWLRLETEDKDIILVADEMVSGFGRTGRWWASDHAGIAPDILRAARENGLVETRLDTTLQQL